MDLSRGRAFEMLVRQILVFRRTLSPITSFLDQGSSGTSEQNSTNSVNRRPFAWESWWDLLFNKLDDGWPESEKHVFSSSSEYGSRKKIVGEWLVEFYMRYGGVSCEK